MLLAGVVLVLWGIWKGGFTESLRGIWPAGIGTVLVVLSVFFLAGFGGTAYYPSLTDLQSSLTLENSSSSRFTLTVMFWVSLLIPFVLAYIVYAWRAMDRKSITAEEMDATEHKY
jgi:cytochrome d ubiquinol oxidase subunit II